MKRYWGAAEIAEQCGVSPAAVSNWIARGKIPEPAFRLRMGPVWDATKPAFNRWLKDRQKRAATLSS